MHKKANQPRQKSMKDLSRKWQLLPEKENDMKRTSCVRFGPCDIDIDTEFTLHRLLCGCQDRLCCVQNGMYVLRQQ